MENEKKFRKGFVKLNRTLLDSEVIKNPNAWHLYTWALLRANFKKANVNGLEIDVDEFLLSKKTIPDELSFMGDSFWDVLHKLNDKDYINLKDASSSYIVQVHHTFKTPINNNSSYNNSYNDSNNKKEEKNNSFNNSSYKKEENKNDSFFISSNNKIFYLDKINYKKGNKIYGKEVWEQYITLVKLIIKDSISILPKPLTIKEFKELLKKYTFSSIKLEVKELSIDDEINEDDSIFDLLSFLLKPQI